MSEEFANWFVNFLFAEYKDTFNSWLEIVTLQCLHGKPSSNWWDGLTGISWCCLWCSHWGTQARGCQLTFHITCHRPLPLPLPSPRVTALPPLPNSHYSLSHLQWVNEPTWKQHHSGPVGLGLGSSPAQTKSASDHYTCREDVTALHMQRRCNSITHVEKM